MAGGDQLGQGRNREIRRAKESEAHGSRLAVRTRRRKPQA
jgi:hypothetical protein